MMEAHLYVSPGPFPLETGRTLPELREMLGLS